MYSTIMNEIVYQQYESELDVLFTLCEYYQKQMTYDVYMEEVVATGGNGQPALQRKEHKDDGGYSEVGKEQNKALDQMSSRLAAKQSKPPTLDPPPPPDDIVPKARPMQDDELLARRGDVSKQGAQVTADVNQNTNQQADQINQKLGQQSQDLAKISATLQKILDVLTQFLGKFIGNTMNEQALKQEKQNQEFISNLPNDPNVPKTQEEITQLANTVVSEIEQEENTNPQQNQNDPSHKLDLEYTIGILTGKFQGANILSSKSLEVLNGVTASLNYILKNQDNASANPDAFAQNVIQDLQKQNAILSQLIGQATQDDNSNANRDVVMDYIKFVEIENKASEMIVNINKQLKVVDQSFKTGGIAGFFKYAATANINAKKISQQAMTELQNTLKNVRATVTDISKRISKVRKINSKLIRHIKGNNNAMNKAATSYANAQNTMDKTAAKAGISGHPIASMRYNQAQKTQDKAVNKLQQLDNRAQNIAARRGNQNLGIQYQQ